MNDSLPICCNCFNCIQVKGKVKCLMGHYTDHLGNEKEYELETIMYPHNDFINKYLGCKDFSGEE